MDIKEYPLLMQGFRRPIPINDQTTTNFTLTKQRGKVYKLQPLQDVGTFFPIPTCFFSLRAGGQDLISNADLGQYNLFAWNQPRDIPVVLTGGQTIQVRVDNGSNIAQVLRVYAFYTYKWLEEWKKTCSFGNALAQKSFAFSITIPAATTDTLDGLVPKDRGNIIGFSITAFGVPVELAATEYDFLINGVTVHREVSMLQWGFSSLVQKSFIPLPITPAADFELVINGDNTIQANDYTLTFFFDN